MAKDTVILTGDRPTGRLHIGHYVGSLKRRVELQNAGDFKKMFVFIADAQALTDNIDNPEKVRQNVIEVALDYLACGLDPEKITIFIQSQIPELCELSFYFMDLVTVSRLQRNPTVKTEIGMRGFESSIPVGFFTYPISQAADITAFKATTVPAGEDQKPMLEQATEIVRRFNHIYGETLVEPNILLPQNAVCCRLPGTDGKAKMSKSLGNCIYLAESAKEVEKKVKSMYTDPTHLRVEDPGHIEGNTVFTYLDAFCKPEHFGLYWPDYQSLDEVKEHYQRGGLGDMKVKKFLNKVLEAELGPIRERRKMWEQRIPDVYDILQAGSEVAEKKAAETLNDVREAMKINYFDGDFALKNIANILMTSFRASDIVGRIGGDEFVCFAFIDDLDFPKTVQAKIQELSNELNETCGKPYYIEMSVGVSEFSCDPDIKIEDLLSQADSALYSNKRYKRMSVLK